jgi:hypothetical protein
MLLAEGTGALISYSAADRQALLTQAAGSAEGVAV